ncbi:MAG: hypothetical protein FJ387_03615 [Verrucomicrobia bacterium]|nr:hypothetical protein [Verrucomicrobiota bacterium]
MATQLDRAKILAALPPPWAEDLLPAIRSAAAAAGRKLVVLDDDPTGTQTVYGVPVLTRWDPATLKAELASEPPGFYLLTNSRSLPPQAASALNREIAQNLLLAVQPSRPNTLPPAGAHPQSPRPGPSPHRPLPFTLVSRSDSTLRGHFPDEVLAIVQIFGPPDAVLVIPFFEAGGRYTLDDVHYVAEGDWLVPAGETPFARDPVFGYRSSNLRDWVAEKCGQGTPANMVSSVSLDDLRQGGPARVCQRLLELPRASFCIVNAACQRDLEVLVCALLDAETHGRNFLCRTAAPFVAARLGLAPRPLLTATELPLPAHGGGLTLVGSHVPKTTEQLGHLLSRPGLRPIELAVERLLAPAERSAELAAGLAATNAALAANIDAVVFTSRHLITGQDAEANLAIGQQVSEALVHLVRGLTTPPRYLVAKGGITSSDVATRALGVRRAMVIGQLLPGVPVWELGPETRYPGLPYVVFPGNVGGPEALREAVDRLSLGSLSSQYPSKSN